MLSLEIKVLLLHIYQSWSLADLGIAEELLEFNLLNYLLLFIFDNVIILKGFIYSSLPKY